MILSRETLKAIFHPKSKPTSENMADFIDSYLHKTEDRSYSGLQEYTGRPYLSGETCMKEGVMYQAKTDTQGKFNKADWQTCIPIGNIDTVPEGMSVMIAENYQLCVFDMFTLGGFLDIKGILIIKQLNN